MKLSELKCNERYRINATELNGIFMVIVEGASPVIVFSGNVEGRVGTEVHLGHGIIQLIGYAVYAENAIKQSSFGFFVGEEQPDTGFLFATMDDNEGSLEVFILATNPQIERYTQEQDDQ